MRMVAFIMAFLVFIQSLGMEQELLRMNELITHAQYHKQNMGDSFWEFLEKHYADDQATHENQHQDQKEAHHNLPFHGEHAHGHVVVGAFVNQTNYSVVKPLMPETTEKTSFFYLNRYDLLKEAVIFKPPC